MVVKIARRKSLITDNPNRGVYGKNPGLTPERTSRKVIPLHKYGLSAEKTQEILKLWRENSENYPEKSAAYLPKLTAGQARVDFTDVVWAIIEDSRR